MAIGDAISLHLAASTDLQPAAGVEDVINHVQGSNANLAQFKDGAATINILEWPNTITSAKDIRIWITNDSFIGTIAAGPGWVHGVQENS